LHSAFLLWLNEIEDFVDRGLTGAYAEAALNNILDKLVLSQLYFNKYLCFEIDTKEDLEIAKDLINF